MTRAGGAYGAGHFFGHAAHALLILGEMTDLPLTSKADFTIIRFDSVEIPRRPFFCDWEPMLANKKWAFLPNRLYVWIIISILAVLSGCSLSSKQRAMGPVPWMSWTSLDIAANEENELMVAADDRGVLHFAWREQSHSQSLIKVSSFSNENVAGPVIRIGTFPDSVIHPLLQVVNPRGDIAVIAVVRAPEGNWLNIWHKGADHEWVDTGKYLYQVLPLPEEVNLVSADIALNGNLLVAWSDGYEIEAGICSVSQPCKRVTGTQADTSEVISLKVNFDFAGNAHLIWSRNEAVMTALFQADSDANWSPPQTLGTLAIASDVVPAVASSARGMMVVWVGSDEGAVVLQARIFHPEKGWSKIYPLRRMDQEPWVLDLGYDDQGDALVVWSESIFLPHPKGETDSLFALRYVAESDQWDPLVRLDSDKDYTSKAPVVPAIAMTPEGKALIVWHDHEEEVKAMGRQFDPQLGWGMVTGIPKSLPKCLFKQKMQPLAAGRELLLAYGELGCPGVIILRQQHLKSR